MVILAQWTGMACLVLWGFWLCGKLRLPAGFAPAAGLAFGMTALQLLGSLDLLWLGARLLLAGAVLLMVHRRRRLVRDLLRPGVLAFAAGMAVLQIAFALRTPEFQTWDEFSHWGIYFKSVFYEHRFALWDTARSLAHQSYPQGVPALYALFAQLVTEYRESDVLFVTALPLAAAVGALFELFVPRGRRARLLHTVCGCLAAPALFRVFAPDTPYTTAYMDAPVGAMLAAGLLLCLLPCDAGSRIRRGLAVGLFCAAVTTVKEIGTVFALCLLGIWFLQCLADAVPSADGLRRQLVPLGAALLPAAAVPVAWKILLFTQDRGVDQFTSMGPGYFLRCMRNNRSYFLDIWGRYYARIRSYPLLFGCSTFKIGCLCIAAAVLLALALMRLAGRRRGLTAALPALCMAVYWPLYHAVLFYVYICGMSAEEASRMASWDRYFCCFFIGWFAALAGELLLAAGLLADTGFALRRISCLPACLLAVAGLVSLRGGPVDALTLPAASWRAAQRATAQSILEKTSDGPLWLLTADQEIAVQNRWYYQYELYPALVAVETPAVQAEADLFYNVSEHQIRYLVLFGLDDRFVDNYAALADDGLAAARGSEPAVYAVTGEGETLRLVLQ